MLKLKRLSVRKCRLPRYFRARSRRFVFGRPGSRSALEEVHDVATQDTTEAPARTDIAVVDLFPATLLQVEQLRLREKYGSRRKRKKKTAKRVKGLQYKLQYWKGVNDKARERKFTAQTRDADQTNDLVWNEEEAHRIAALLVDRSFEEAFQRSQKDPNKIAEIVAWLDRRYDDSAFNFETCCSVAGYNADELRDRFYALLDRKYGTRFPHYRVLRNGIIDAEHGDSDAIEWVLSDATTPMSFVDCCKALSFDPEKARAEILLPVVVDSFDELTSDADDVTSREYTFAGDVAHAA